MVLYIWRLSSLNSAPSEYADDGRIDERVIEAGLCTTSNAYELGWVVSLRIEPGALISPWNLKPIVAFPLIKQDTERDNQR